MPLTPEELRIVDELGFDHVIAESVRAQGNSPLQRLKRLTEMGAAEPAAGFRLRFPMARKRNGS